MAKKPYKRDPYETVRDLTEVFNTFGDGAKLWLNDTQIANILQAGFEAQRVHEGLKKAKTDKIMDVLFSASNDATRRTFASDSYGVLGKEYDAIIRDSENFKDGSPSAPSIQRMKNLLLHTHANSTASNPS